MNNVIEILARELNKTEEHVKNVVTLIVEGNTIPFIARYRKEMHGAMDDTVLRALGDRLSYLRNLEARREEIKKAIAAQDKLTETLSADIDAAQTLAEVEDIYRPYKQKRHTRATLAKEKGLEPLAMTIFQQCGDLPDIRKLAEKYIDAEKDVKSADDALAGASDIIAEMISDSADIRRRLRELFMNKGVVNSVVAKEEDSVYRLYYKFGQSVSRLQGHQILAINRGEKEGFLKVSLDIDRDLALRLVWNEVAKPESKASDFVRSAAADGFDRLLFPPWSGKSAGRSPTPRRRERYTTSRST